MLKIFFFIIGIFPLGFISFSSAQEFPELGIKVETVAENLKISLVRMDWN